MKIPPRTIMLDHAILLCYALLNERVGYTVGHGLFFVDGKEIGRVPCLAICKEKDSGLFTLYYCDEGWNPLGVATYETVDAAKRRAERIYTGSSTRWMDAPNFSNVAVGTIVTDRPPHRSVQALLRIRLPPGMSSEKTGGRIRMQNAWSGNPAREDAGEAIPRDAASLTPAAQNETPESSQALPEDA